MTADGSANGSDNKWIGKRTIRPDGEDKVTGRANFAADYAMAGMLTERSCAALTPTPSSNRSRSRRRWRCPGVKAVMTGQDDHVQFPWDKAAPLGIQDLRYNSRNVMARRKSPVRGPPCGRSCGDLGEDRGRRPSS